MVMSIQETNDNMAGSIGGNTIQSVQEHLYFGIGVDDINQCL